MAGNHLSKLSSLNCTMEPVVCECMCVCVLTDICGGYIPGELVLHATNLMSTMCVGFLSTIKVVVAFLPLLTDRLVCAMLCESSATRNRIDEIY